MYPLHKKKLATENSFKSLTSQKDCVFITRLSDKKIVSVNDMFLAKTGVEKDESIGTTLSNIKIWTNKKDYTKFLKVLKNPNKFNSFETTIFADKGKILPVNIYGGIIQYEGEDCIFAVIRDISKIKETEKYLHESNLKYRTLFEHANNAIILENEDEEILDANQAASDMFGYSHDELLKKKMSDLLIRKKENLGSYVNSINGTPSEVLANHMNKTTFWVDMTVAPLAIDGTIRYLTSIRNISERRMLEEQLEQAAKMEAVGKLTGSIAHDFNNVLTIIQGFSELALAMVNEKQIYNYLIEINKAALKAESLIGQLLSFSRKHTEKIEIFDINELIVDMRHMFDRLIGENIELCLEVSESPYFIKSDPGKIEQVILNLVVNARDAISGKGVLKIKTKRIKVKTADQSKYGLKKSGKHIVLEVIDTGKGIEPHLKEKIFKPFFTTKENKMGTGLGLATVYRIINQLGGQIEVDSNENEGTTFRIFIPESERKRKITPTPKTISDQYKGTETVLVVEDQDELRSVVCQTLTKYGYKVMDAENAQKASALFDKTSKKIDLLLTDIIMPDINGFELAQSLSKKSQDLKILYMSGYNEEVLKNYGSIVSDQNFLQKPFAPLLLLEKIRSVINYNQK